MVSKLETVEPKIQQQTQHILGQALVARHRGTPVSEKGCWHCNRKSHVSKNCYGKRQEEEDVAETFEPHGGNVKIWAAILLQRYEQPLSLIAQSLQPCPQGLKLPHFPIAAESLCDDHCQKALMLRLQHCLHSTGSLQLRTCHLAASCTQVQVCSWL